MNRMCAGLRGLPEPGPPRAVVECWAQPPWHVVLALLGGTHSQRITQQCEGAARARREVPGAPGASRGLTEEAGAVGCGRAGFWEAGILAAPKGSVHW